MSDEVKVELRPHVGRMVKEGIEQEVEHDQYIVFAHCQGQCKQVGYIGKPAGRRFCWTDPFNLFSKKNQEFIAKEAERLRDAHEKGGANPKPEAPTHHD